MRSRQFSLAFTFTWLVAGVISGSSAFAQGKPDSVFNGHGSNVTGFAFHPDGSRVASASFRDVRIWERTTGKELVDVKRTRGFAVAFTPDGQRLAVGGYEAVTIHDVSNGEQVTSFDPHGEWDRKFPFPPLVMALAFSPDGRWLATAASIAKVGGRHGLPGGVVKVFDVATGKELRDVGRFSSGVVAVAFSPDGKHLAAGSTGASSEVPESGELRVWNTTKFELLFAHKGGVPDDTGDDRWSSNSVAFSPDGTRLASASHDHLVRVWDVPGGREVLTLKGHTRWVGGVTFTLKGEHIVSAGGDGVARVWDATKGAHLRSIPFDSALSLTLSLSSDGLWLGVGGGTFQGPGVARVSSLAGNDKK